MNTFQINTNKEKFKDNRDLATLLDYYRIKLDKFDEERKDWLEKLETIRQNLEEHHRLQWEIQTRNTEVLNLQINKSEITKGINLERQRVSQLSSELEFYKERSNQDRKRIIQLLQLTEPIEQQVKIFHNKIPHKTEKFHDVIHENTLDIKKISNQPVDLSKSSCIYSTQAGTNNTNIMSNSKYGRLNTSHAHIHSFHNQSLNMSACMEPRPVSRQKSMNKSMKYDNSQRGRQIRSSTNPHYKKIRPPTQKNLKNSSLLEARIRPSTEKQHIIRSVVFPNNEKSDLNEEISFLKKQISDIRTFYEDMLQKQSLQQKDHEKELNLHLENEKSKITEIQKQRQKAEELNIILTKEIVTLKCENSKNERATYEELDLVKLQNQALITAMKELSTHKDLEKKNYLSEQERRNETVLGNMRQQLKNYQENTRIMKEQYKQIQNIFNTRMNELIDKYNSLQEKYFFLEDQIDKKDGGSQTTSKRRRSKNFDNMNLLVSEINSLNKRIKALENADLSKKDSLSRKESFVSQNSGNNLRNNNTAVTSNKHLSKSKSLNKSSFSKGNKSNSNNNISQHSQHGVYSQFNIPCAVNPVLPPKNKSLNKYGKPQQQQAKNTGKNIRIVDPHIHNNNAADDDTPSSKNSKRENFIDTKSLNTAEIKKKLRLANTKPQLSLKKLNNNNVFVKNNREERMEDLKKQYDGIQSMYHNLLKDK